MKHASLPSRLASACAAILPCLLLASGQGLSKDITITLPDGRTAVVDDQALKSLMAGHPPAAPAAPKAMAKADGETPKVKEPVKNIDWFDFTAGKRLKVVDQLIGGEAHRVVPLAEAAQRESLVGSAPAGAEATPADLGPVQEGFRLRQTWDAVKLFEFKDGQWQETATSGTDSDGAEFGWSRNRRSGLDTWNAKGVAYFPILMKANEDEHFLLLPSLEFNRDSSTDGTPNEINSLIARLGVDFNCVTPTGANGGMIGMVYRAAVGYQTDFNLSSGQWLFDLQGEPVDEKNGVGVFALKTQGDGDGESHEWLKLPGTRRKFTIAPILELADISDLGGKAALAQLEKQYATVGFKVGLDFEIESVRHLALLSGLKVGAEYRWWSTLGSKSASYDYLEAHVTLPFFGSDDKLMLKAFYRDGDTPDTLEKVDMMGLALTAKF